MDVRVCMCVRFWCLWMSVLEWISMWISVWMSMWMFVWMFVCVCPCRWPCMVGWVSGHLTSRKCLLVYTVHGHCPQKAQRQLTGFYTFKTLYKFADLCAQRLSLKAVCPRWTGDSFGELPGRHRAIRANYLRVLNKYLWHWAYGFHWDSHCEFHGFEWNGSVRLLHTHMSVSWSCYRCFIMFLP